MLWHHYQRPSKGVPWRDIATFIESNEKDGEPLLIYPGYDAVALSYYYQGRNTIASLPDEAAATSYPPRPLTDERQVDLRLDAFGHSQRFWLIANGSSNHNQQHLGIDYNWSILEEFVRHRCAVVRSMEFGGTTIWLLQRRLTKQR